jgi:hypothetical protein
MGPWKNPWSTEFEELWDSTPQSIQTELREAVRRKKAEDRAIATFFSNFDLPFESER